MSRRRKVLVVAAVFLALSLLTTAIFRSAWFKQQIVSWMQTTLEEKYGIRLEMDAFEYSLQGGFHLAMSGVRAYERSKPVPFFTAERLEIQAPYSVLWSSSKVVDRIAVRAPVLDLDHLPRFDTGGAANETSVQIRSIRVESGAFNMEQREVRNLELEMSLDGDRIRVKNAAGEYNGVSLKSKGTVELDPVRLDLTYDAEGNLSVISKFAPEAPQISGPFHASGKVSGGAADMRIDAALRSDELSVAGASPASLTGNVQYEFNSEKEPLRFDMQWQRLPMSALARINPKVPEIHSNASGRFMYSGGFDLWTGAGSIEATLVPTKGALPLGGRLAGVLGNESLVLSEANLSLRSLQAQIHGSVDRNSLDLKVNATTADLRELASLVPELRMLPAEAAFEGTLRGNYESLRIQGVSNLSAYSSRVRVDGFYDLGDDSLKAEFQGNVSNELWARAGLPDVAGELEFTGQAYGNSRHPVMDVSLSSRDLAYSRVQLGALEGKLKSDGKSLNADFDLTDLHTSVSAVYTWKTEQFILNSAFQDLSTSVFSSLMPEALGQMEGRVTGTLNVTGNAKRWKNAIARAEITNAVVKHKAWNLDAVASGSISMQEQLLDLDVRVQSQSNEIRITGKAPLDAGKKMDLNIEGNLDAATVSMIFPDYEVSGRAEVDVNLSGTRTIPQISGEMKLDAVNAARKDQKFRIQNLTGSMKLQENIVQATLQGLLNEARVELIASIPLEKKPGTVKLAVRDLQLSTFFPGSNVAGHANLDLSATGKGINPADWNGSATLQISELKTGSDEISVAEPIRVNLDRGVVTVQAFHLNAAGLLDATVGGTYHLKTGAVQSELQAQADLSLISQFMADLQGSGPVKIDRKHEWNVQSSSVEGLCQCGERISPAPRLSADPGGGPIRSALR